MIPFAVTLLLAAADLYLRAVPIDGTTMRDGVMQTFRSGGISFDLTLGTTAKDGFDAAHPIVEEPGVKADAGLSEDYYKVRGGPNVTIEVFAVDGERRTPVPTRVIVRGSGGGQSTVFQVVTIVILSPDREARVEELVGCMVRALPETMREAGKPAFKQYLVNVIDMPRGTYEVQMRYEPKTGALAGKTLTAQTLRVVVEDGPDPWTHFCEQWTKKK